MMVGTKMEIAIKSFFSLFGEGANVVELWNKNK